MIRSQIKSDISSAVISPVSAGGGSFPVLINPPTYTPGATTPVLPVQPTRTNVPAS